MRNYEDYTIEENVQYINQLLNDGLSMKQIEEDHYNVSERVIVKRLIRRGYKRSSEGNRLFVLVDSTKANTKPNKANRKRDKSDTKATKTNNIFSDEEVQKLKQLINNYDDIMYMCSKCNTTNTQHIHDIEDIQIIQTYNTKQKMFRVDVEVLERWSAFCEEYKHIKVQSLISSALLEYIEKYSKR